MSTSLRPFNSEIQHQVLLLDERTIEVNKRTLVNSFYVNREKGFNLSSGTSQNVGFYFFNRLIRLWESLNAN